jgi:DNA-binding transcriptional regulator YdaS (Cro superfamily)
MKLADYLKENGIKRTEFAALVKVSPQTITGWCDGKFGISTRRAKEVFDKTNGAVTPNDFLDVEEVEQ